MNGLLNCQRYNWFTRDNIFRHYQGKGVKLDMSLDQTQKTLQKFSALVYGMPISYALAYIEVAKDEGLSITTLADRLDTPLSTISRVVAALSDPKKYDLIKVTIDSDEKRRKIISLTKHGHDFLKTL